MLGITCDNASNNDAMVEQLAFQLRNFEGEFHRVRCFAHIINLVAKSLLRQFDVREAKAGEADAAIDEDVRELLALADRLEEEDRVAVNERREDEGEDAGLEDDKQWVDEVAAMNEYEREEFEREVRPVKMVIVKVSCQGRVGLGIGAGTDRETRSVSSHTKSSIPVPFSPQRGSRSASSTK